MSDAGSVSGSLPLTGSSILDGVRRDDESGSDFLEWISDAGRAAPQPASPSVALAAGGASESAEGKVFPLGLRAHGYQDQLHGSGLFMSPPDVEPHSGSVPLLDVGVRLDIIPPVGPATHRAIAAAAARPGSGVSLGVAQTAPLPPSPAPAAHVVSGSGAAPPAGAGMQPWERRAIHLVRSEDGTTTVWVRDFDLAAGEIESVVQSARQTWPGASRVMVNGLTAWSSNEEERA